LAKVGKFATGFEKESSYFCLFKIFFRIEMRYPVRKNLWALPVLLLIICLPVFAFAQAVLDADILSPTRRNEQFIRRQGIHVRQVTVDVGKQRFVIYVFTKKGKKTQTIIVVQDLCKVKPV
jgi:hypothetical protein